MSKLKSKVIHINGRRTSIRLCSSEWLALEEICRREKLSRKLLFETIERYSSGPIGLTGSIRLFSIVYFHDIIKNSEVVKNTPILPLLERLF